MSLSERFEATKENLKRLMLYRHDDLDPAAIYVHYTNDNMARLRSRRMSMADSLALALKELGNDGVQLDGIWGEHDITATPWVIDRAAMLNSNCETARFAVIADAGHWVSFEKATHSMPCFSTI